MSISKIFIPNFVCVLTNERYKHIRCDFHSVAGVMPQGWDLGVLGDVKNFSKGICNGTPSSAPSNLIFLACLMKMK